MSGPYDHAWRKVRGTVLAEAALHDGGVPLCRIKGPTCTNTATQVDHKVPLNAGGARLDPANLRPCCRPCNIWRAQKEKSEAGWRRAKTRVVLVVGPPGAGKSTYAREHAGPKDLVVDYDDISAALGPTLSRGTSQRHGVVMAARNAILSKLRRGETDAETAWIVSTNPRAEDQFFHHEVVLIDPGEDVVLAQAARAGRPASFAAIIRNWYSRRAASSSSAAAASREW